MRGRTIGALFAILALLNQGGCSKERTDSDNERAATEARLELDRKVTEVYRTFPKLVQSVQKHHIKYAKSEEASADEATATNGWRISSAGPNPPLGACCRAGGQCPADPSIWQKGIWKELNFAIREPHYYSYAIKAREQSDEGDERATNTSFQVMAYGDLDCDGVYSTYVLDGDVHDSDVQRDENFALMERIQEFE